MIGHRLAIACTALMAVAGQAAEKTARPPNIVVILADDLGYGDVHRYNPQRGKFSTPHIDRLAAEGMRFTDAHSSSGVCTPSRYTLLTGRYHWRTRLQNGVLNGWGEPLVAAGRLTIPKMLKRQGYHTTCIGKWHLGMGIDPALRNDRQGDGAAKTNATDSLANLQITDGPITRGFDEYFGISASLDMPPFAFIENDRFTQAPTVTKKWVRSGPAAPDFEAIDVLPRLAERASQCIAAQAKRARPFFLYLALTSPHTPLVPTPVWQGKSGFGDYGDFVMETDWAVGLVLEAIAKAGISENTLVVFTADNGCAPYIGVGELEKQGHYPSGPLRGYKADVWEGGHRVPFVVRWPGVVRPGGVCGQLAQQADLMATFAAIVDAKLPDDAGEDSFSLLALLKGGSQAARANAVNCSIQGVPSIRSGPWKLILAPGSGGWSKGSGDQPVQLYNLDQDLGETRNLAAEQPDRVAQMKALLEGMISAGRSTPGPAQKNDAEVRRFPREDKEKPGKQKKRK